MNSAVVVLAAGEGKRMKSSLPKVLHPVLGRSLLGHVLAATAQADADRTVVVVGHGADQVRAHLAEIAPQAQPVLQAEQRGTGHATRVALESAGIADGSVIVINGDVPLLRPETLRGVIAAHETAGAAATVLTAVVGDPTGLGRIIRDERGGFDAIIEHRDATEAQREIREINSGVYVFDVARLVTALGKLHTHNDQGEEYLTDVISLLVDSGQPVLAHPTADPTEVAGANDRVELAALGALMRDRINTGWMREGVTIIDPASTWIEVGVTLGRDAIIEPNTHLRGTTAIGELAVIGPDTTLIDVYVDRGAHVVRAHAVGARIGADVHVGPYAYLRPGTVLHPKSKVGTFVEVKNSELGTGTKVPHLSYIGDATIGEHTNIGAANVVVNYDGVTKSRTVVGSHVRTGSDTMLVAPVTIGDGAYTAAGSVITNDVPPGALGVARERQRNIEGWVERRRAGTGSAQAAAEAKAAKVAGTLPGAGDAAVPASEQPAEPPVNGDTATG